MDKGKIRKQAADKIHLGYTRQHVLDELVIEHPDLRPKRLAKVVRYVPSEAARYHYRLQQQGLLAAIVLFAALEFLRPFAVDHFHGGTAFQWMRVLPLATVLLGIAVYRYRGEVYQWLAIVNFAGALGLAGIPNDIAEGTIDPWELATGSLSLIICVLAWYLSSHLYSDFKTEKDPTGIDPPRIVFPPEPGVLFM